MSKIKSRPAYLIILLLPLIIPVICGGGKDEPFLDLLRRKLESYNEQYNSEKSFILTDRYVYRPGEVIWFKGFVSPILNARNNGNDFFIRLLNSNGEEIIYRRYPLNDQETSGSVAIPKSCIPGKYWLVAYSGWMKNQSPEEAFRKEILISKYFEKRFNVEISYDKTFYYPGDTLTALLKINDATGKSLPETDFDYNLSTLKKTEFKGSGKTDVKGKAKITAVIPETDELLMLTCEVRSRKISGDYSQIVPSFTGRPAITFYPEGGNLVSGIRSKVAVKSVNRYGLPQPIKAVIADATGSVTDSVQTNSEGLGVFEYVPGPDSCYLKVISPHGLQNKYAIPDANMSGIVIQYTGSRNNSAVFMLRSNRQRETCYLTAVINRKLVWSSRLDFKDSTLIKIPLSNMEASIMQVSVFDENQALAAERTILAEGKAEPLVIKMDRKVYLSRQRVSVLVEYPENLVSKNLALSVSLKKLGTAPNENHMGSLQQCKPVRDSGDLQLMTSDCRSVQWGKVVNSKESQEPFTKRDGLIGTVYDKKENISPHAKVRVTHFPGFRLYETQTDENGLFHVNFGSDVIDYRFLNIDAYDASGKVNLNTKIDYSYVDRLREIITAENRANETSKVSDLINYGEPDLVYVLRFGPGKFRKTGTDTYKKYDPYKYSRYTDVLDIIQDIKPYRLSDDKIIFTEPFRGTDSASMEEAILVINGVLKGNKTGALRNIIPSDITNISVSTSLFDVHKYTPLNFRGVIEITTIQGSARYRQAPYQTSSGVFTTSEKQFYSPDYAIESSYSADNRRTLYWNPKIEYRGNSMLVTFYTSDIKGTYYGHLAGLDQEGNPVEGEFTFDVE